LKLAGRGCGEGRKKGEVRKAEVLPEPTQTGPKKKKKKKGRCKVGE
jgi:hypothetical protein